MTKKKSNKKGLFLLGALLGTVVGATAGFLTAPKCPEETKKPEPTKTPKSTKGKKPTNKKK